MKKFIGSNYANSLFGALVYFVIMHFVFRTNTLLHDLLSALIFYIVMTTYLIFSKKFKKQSHQNSQK